MPAFSWMYCGMRRYFAKASCQAASLSGGRAPTMGSHCVIERPEPVMRVSPPTVTIPKMRSAMANSQNATACRLRQKGSRVLMTPA